MRLDTAYIILGGDRFYEDFYGKIKSVKFFYDTILSESGLECLRDEHCSECSNDGVCLKCHQDYHLV